MAAADTARLIAQLTLDDKGFSKGLGRANKELGKLESTAFRVGQHIGAGTKATLANIAKIGLVTGGVIAVAVKGGLSSLAELESAITSVDGAIEQMGFTGQVTGKQVAGWANQIEADIGAAFDDKEITQAATTLLRFGKVTPKNLKPALTVIADLATKTGDVESAATLLARALADPAKAAGKLSRAGIVLTKAQQDQIKAMLATNDVAGAQALILEEVAKSTEGAALASQGPYAQAMSKLKDVTEDAQRALAIGFLPVLTKVANLLGKELAKPETLANIQKFGEGLAGGLDDLIDVAKNLPWATIGESLKLGAAGATSILKAFTSLPPWVQTAVLTGWGLNKLTGGALGGIVSELGKGLVKGVLGINAGVVNVNARAVTGAGLAGGPGGAAGAPSTLSKIANVASKVFIVGAAAAFIASLVGIRNEQSDQNKAAAAGVVAQSEVFIKSATLEEMKRSLEGLRAKQAELTNGLTPEAIAYQLDMDGVKTTLERAIYNVETGIATFDAHSQAAAFATRDALSQKLGFVATLTAGVREAVTSTTAAAREAGRQTAFAIRDKDLSVAVSSTNIINNRVSVSARETISTQTTHKQYHRYIS